MNIKEKDFSANASGIEAVEELGNIAKEREKTKRLLIGASCRFFAIGAIVFVFAPQGKETLGNIIGAALIIMALGAIGAAQFRFKLPGIEVDTRTTNNSNDNSASNKRPSRMNRPA